MHTPPPTLEIRAFVGAQDFEQSTAFYRALGFTIAYDSTDLRLLQLGTCCFYLQRAYVKEWCDNTMLFLSVENVDAWYAFAKQAVGVRIGSAAGVGGPPQDGGYGRVFYVFDPTGILLHVAQFHA